MSLILQEIDIKVEKINGTSYADVNPYESPAKRSGGGTAGSPTSPYRHPLETMPDQEYVRSMEERYGIGEEGIF